MLSNLPNVTQQGSGKNRDLNSLTPESVLLMTVLPYHVAVVSPFHFLSGSFLICSLRV